MRKSGCAPKSAGKVNGREPSAARKPDDAVGVTATVAVAVAVGIRVSVGELVAGIVITVEVGTAVGGIVAGAQAESKSDETTIKKKSERCMKVIIDALYVNVKSTPSSLRLL